MPDDDSFAALLAAQPKQGRQRNLRIGDTIEAVVIRVGKDTIFLELDGKRQAMLDAIEMRKPDGTIDVKEGDMLRADVIHVDEMSGSVRLGRSLGRSRDRGQTEVRTYDGGVAPEAATVVKTVGALPVGTIVQGNVVRVESYGVFVQVKSVEGRDGRGLVPLAELGAPRGADLRKMFPEGTELTLKVLEAADGRLKLSVKGAKEDAERAEFETHKDQASAGSSFGTFADLLKKR